MGYEFTFSFVCRFPRLLPCPNHYTVPTWLLTPKNRQPNARLRHVKPYVDLELLSVKRQCALTSIKLRTIGQWQLVDCGEVFVRLPTARGCALSGTVWQKGYRRVILLGKGLVGWLCVNWAQMDKDVVRGQQRLQDVPMQLKFNAVGPVTHLRKIVSEQFYVSTQPEGLIGAADVVLHGWGFFADLSLHNVYLP